MRSSGAGRRPGRQPMVDKQREYARLIWRGFSNSAACRQLGIDRKIGNWWKNGGVVTRGDAIRVVKPILDKFAPNAEKKSSSGRYLNAEERVKIADGTRTGLTATAIVKELGRAVSTVTRELKRNVTPKGSYHPWSANEMAWARRSRPRKRLLESDLELRELVQGYLDKRWSPEQIAHKLRTKHGRRLAVETIYQALYDPNIVLEREARVVLRTRRPHRRSRRRVDARRPRFIVPISMIEDRPSEVETRSVPGHWEGDLIVGSYNRSAIGTLLERTTPSPSCYPWTGRPERKPFETS
jgi:transposase, IS30 family